MNNQTIEWAREYPNIKNCSIQTFSDTKQENKYSRIMPMTRENLERCEKLQSKLPYGVYFSVNPMVDGKRNAESVEFIQTWICDIDDGSKEEQLELIKNAPLKPTFVVESVHGFHLYYFADNHLTKEQYEEGNLGLMDYYHGDIKVCKDIARVLRIPGFYHMKGEPVMVEFRKDLSGFSFYSVEEMTKAFPKSVEEAKKPEIKPIPKNTYSCSDSYWEKVNKLNNRQMLLELSGTRWVNGEIIGFKRNGDGTEQITIDGKPRSCWIDECGMIGSSDKGGPTWVQRIEWYLGRKLTTSEWYDISKRMDANHPELKETNKEVKKIDVNKLREKKLVRKGLEKPDFTWGEVGLDNAIGKISRGQLVILSGETGAGKTTFATFMARKNPDSYYFVLEDTMENIARRYALKRAGITKDELNNGTWGSYKETSYSNAYDRFINQEINYLDVGEKVKVTELIDAMKQLKEEGFGMFFIDNLGFVIGDGSNETEQTADISSKLVSFCIREKVCVVLLHHFKKGDGTNKPRDISQLRGSGKIGDDSFLVANYMRIGDGTVLRVLKDRNRGDLKDYVMRFDRGDYIYESTEDW